MASTNPSSFILSKSTLKVVGARYQWIRLLTRQRWLAVGVLAAWRVSPNLFLELAGE